MLRRGRSAPPRTTRYPLNLVAYGSGSVGDTVEGQLSGGWADGGVGSVDLGGVHNGLVLPGGSGGCESSKSDDG